MDDRIIGKWRQAELMCFDKGFNPIWRSVDEIRAEAKTDEELELLRSLQTITVFEPDGGVLSIMKLPEGVSDEEIAAAVASGQIELYGEDSVCLERRSWKEEDGRLFYNTGVKGEMLGEPVSPWVEIKLVGELIELPFARLKRVE